MVLEQSLYPLVDPKWTVGMALIMISLIALSGLMQDVVC